MSDQHIVIIGAGPAGGSAARTLRDRGFDGKVSLVGREPHRPYIRPPLSKQYLRGEADRDSVFMEPESWYPDNHVDLRVATEATSIEPAAHLVQLSEGAPLRYDSLLLATGSLPRRPDLSGTEFGGVRTLRTIDDSEALHDLIAPGGRRVVLIGSGWIGMEVAASARLLGNDVTVLSRDAVPLNAALGDELGAFFADLHSSHGVDFRPATQVASIVGDAGRVSGVRTVTGDLVPADVVLLAMGAEPDLGLARSAGLDLDNGVLVDERLRSSDPDIYAAGDIAHAYHPLGKVRIRSEHFSNALKGGTAAARILLGEDVVYDDLPTFVSEQYDVTFQFAGYAPLIRDARLISRGERSAGSFTAFWLADDRVVAGGHVNVKDPEKKLQGLIRSGRTVDPARLADPSVPLDEV